LAFLLAVAPGLEDEVLEGHPPWASGELPELPGRDRTIVAYHAWAGRAGSQEAAFTGEPAWTPERRFARVFERLALPGFPRAARFDLLAALGAAGLYELNAGELQLAVGEDATTEAAKRIL